MDFVNKAGQNLERKSDERLLLLTDIKTLDEFLSPNQIHIRNFMARFYVTAFKRFLSHTDHLERA